MSLALLAPVLLLFHRALFLPGFVIPFDLQEYHFPLAWQVADGLRSMRLPLWDPYTYCGFPLHANLQAQLFYPPAWPFFAAGAILGPDRMRELLHWQVAAHVWVAGVFAYGLFRRMGLERASALAGALGFELSGYFVAQAQHLGAVCGAAWMPFAWSAAAGFAKQVNMRRMASLAAALSLSFLAGFTPITIVVFVSTAALTAILWAERISHWKLPLAALAAAFWAVLLGAVQLLPTLELSGLSTAYRRATFSEDGGGVPWQAFVSLLDPDRYGVLSSTDAKFGVNPAFLYLYAGLLTAALAGGGLLARHRWRVPLAALVVLHAFWLLGGQTPLGRALWLALPLPVRSATYQEFAAPAFLLAVCGLAALGFEHWVSPRGRLVAGLALAAMMLDPPSQGSKAWMAAMPSDRFPVVTRDIFEESSESPKAARRAVSGTPAQGRLETFRDSLHWMSHAPVLGIPTPNGNDPLAMERALEVRRLYSPMNDWERTGEARRVPSLIMNMLNVRALVSWEDDGEVPPPSHFSLLESVHGHRFWRNPNALPRFYLVSRSVRSSGMQESLKLLSDPAFDPSRVAILEGAAAAAGGEAGGQVNVVLYEPERVTLEYESREPAILVTSEAAHPGWRARLDGQPVPLLLANAAFRAAAAPAGRHRLEMEYAPASLRWGAALSLAAIAALMIAARRQG